MTNGITGPKKLSPCAQMTLLENHLKEDHPKKAEKILELLELSASKADYSLAVRRIINHYIEMQKKEHYPYSDYYENAKRLSKIIKEDIKEADVEIFLQDLLTSKRGYPHHIDDGDGANLGFLSHVAKIADDLRHEKKMKWKTRALSFYLDDWEENIKKEMRSYNNVDEELAKLKENIKDPETYAERETEIISSAEFNFHENRHSKVDYQLQEAVKVAAKILNGGLYLEKIIDIYLNNDWINDGFFNPTTYSRSWAITNLSSVYGNKRDEWKEKILQRAFERGVYYFIQKVVCNPQEYEDSKRDVWLEKIILITIEKDDINNAREAANLLSEPQKNAWLEIL